MKKTILCFAMALVSFPLAFAGGKHAGGHHHDNPQHNHGGHASVVGVPGDAASVTKTIRVDLLDTMRFGFDTSLDHIKKGDVVRFVVTNRGQIPHEFSIGSEAEQNAHRAAMRDMPNMVHDDPNAVTVEPGKTKELIWRFTGSEPVVFACNIPGHSEAGMIATTELGG